MEKSCFIFSKILRKYQSLPQGLVIPPVNDPIKLFLNNSDIKFYDFVCKFEICDKLYQQKILESFDWKNFLKNINFELISAPQLLSSLIKNGASVEAGLSFYNYIAQQDYSPVLPFYSHFIQWAGSAESYLYNFKYNPEKLYESMLSKSCFNDMPILDISYIKALQIKDLKIKSLTHLIINSLEPQINKFGPIFDTLTCQRVINALFRVQCNDLFTFENVIIKILSYTKCETSIPLQRQYYFFHFANFFINHQTLHKDFKNIGWSFLYALLNKNDHIDNVNTYMKKLLKQNLVTKNIYDLKPNLCEDSLHIALLNGTEWSKNLNDVLQFITDADFTCPLTIQTTQLIKSCMEKMKDEKWIGAFTTISNNGQCQNCKSFINPLTLSHEDFSQMRDKFYHEIVAKNVYFNTTPKELERFLSFIRRHKYDVVLDVLNICFSRGYDSDSKKIQALEATINYFVTHKRQKIILIGRLHMLRWKPQHRLSQIFASYPTLLLDDISKDDPFILYAALHGGLGVQIMSKDVYRDHKVLLGERYSQVFDTWRKMHQLYLLKVRPDGHLNILPTLKYAIKPQCNEKGDAYHIPYESGVPLNVYENLNTWLCLQRQS